jgi:hypothetical protein
MNSGLTRKTLFHQIQLRVAMNRSVPVSVGVDDNVYEIRIIKTRGSLIEFGVGEFPIR